MIKSFVLFIFFFFLLLQQIMIRQKMNMLVKMVTSRQTGKLWPTTTCQSPHNRLACNATFPLTGEISLVQLSDDVSYRVFCSSKIHEDDFKREIQTANVNLAPEIVQVFAHSQIFHDHKPLKAKATSPQPTTFSIGSPKVDKSNLHQINEEGSKKLLERLEEGNEWQSHLDKNSQRGMIRGLCDDLILHF